MEDALKRLDKLTQEETRMAAAQNLKATHTVDERVKGVLDTVEAIDNKVADVDDRVAGVDDRVKEIAGDVDELRRSSPNLTVLAMLSYASCQGIEYGKARTNGSPHRTPRPTTISHVVLITRKLRHGF